jgi:hypothetical protein
MRCGIDVNYVPLIRYDALIAQAPPILYKLLTTEISPCRDGKRHFSPAKWPCAIAGPTGNIAVRGAKGDEGCAR